MPSTTTPPAGFPPLVRREVQATDGIQSDGSRMQSSALEWS